MLSRQKTSVRTAAVAAVTVALLGVAACSGGDEKTEEAAPGEPDLAGLPAVVAVVNDREITKDDFVPAYTAQFRQASAQAEATGTPVDQDQLKEQTVESLVSNELLVEEAERRDFAASDADVDAALEDFAEQGGAESVEAYLGTLAEQGLDEDAVRAQLQDQVKLDQLLADEAGTEEPTEEELRELYDQAVAQQEQLGQAGGEEAEVPSFDEVRDQLADQAVQQDESEAAQALLADLRPDAEVKVNL